MSVADGIKYIISLGAISQEETLPRPHRQNQIEDEDEDE